MSTFCIPMIAIEKKELNYQLKADSHLSATQ